MHPLDGCSLSNNILVGVHHISDARVQQELQTRQIRIPVRRMTCYYCKARSSQICGKKRCKDQVLKAISNNRTRGYVNQDPPQTARSKRQRLNKQGESSTARAAMTSPVCMEVIEDAASTHEKQEEAVYVNSLVRRLLVERLKDEEEFERLTMYARDVRFDANAGNPKW